MKETGIIMSGNHPQLVIDNTKTMTRRVIVPQPKIVHATYPDGTIETEQLFRDGSKPKCLYGQVDDRLWVRETWATLGSLDSLSPCELDRHTSPIFFRTDSEDFPMYFDKGKWRPSIFMPRWVSRITLEITKIRVERVQEITEEDAEAEGMIPDSLPSIKDCLCDSSGMRHICKFIDLWNSLNAKRGFGWDVNPWVWVIGFRRIELK